MRISFENVELAEFTAGDVRDLYRIRNHESVRRYLANTSSIPYRAHVEWVRKRLLQDDKLLLFLVRLKGEAIGFTQLESKGGNAAEIGVMFRESSRHQVVSYVATVATLYCAFCLLKTDWLISYVVPTHDRALALNRSFGAWEVPSDKPGMVQFRLSGEVCLANENYRKVLERIRDRMEINGEPPVAF